MANITNFFSGKFWQFLGWTNLTHFFLHLLHNAFVNLDRKIIKVLILLKKNHHLGTFVEEKVGRVLGFFKFKIKH